MSRFTVVERLAELFPDSSYWSSLYAALCLIERSRHEADFSRVY